MKNSILIFVIVLLFGCNPKKEKNIAALKDGDIIFQTSQSAQSQAIQLATKSQYSHCGIIYKTGNDFFVFEAVQPVQRIPLEKWIARGKDRHYVVKRLKDTALLTSENLKKMKKTGEVMNGKNYDLYFEWSNDRIYCSELIWKIYKAANIELSKPEELQDFDLTHPAVKEKLKERYGNKIPKHEKVVSPAALFNSDLLKTVIEK